MGAVTRLAREGVEAGTLRLLINRAIRSMHEGTSLRQGELHVSDFTMRDEQWCVRTLVRRYLRGEPRQREATPVQVDGKWREEKWLRVFERAGILRAYQVELRVGLLQGHPDFVLDWGFGPRIVELTGHNSQLDAKLLAQRVAVKRRQNLYYQTMAWWLDRTGRLPVPIRRGGIVLVEDKGNNTFTIHAVPWDAAKARALMARVVEAARWLDRLRDLNSPMARHRVWREMPTCQKTRCEACAGNIYT